MRYGYIYKISNDINDKVYIGQTVRDLQTRFSEHCFDNRSTSKIHKAISKYGYIHFKIEELEHIDINMLDERESYWISYYQSNNDEYGYNILPGGHIYEIRDWKQILIVENNLVSDSKEELARIISSIMGRSIEHIKEKLSQVIDTDKDFCGYHMKSTYIDKKDISDIIDIEEWAKKLNLQYAGKKIYCIELDKDFDTVGSAARYCIDNGYYTGNSQMPVQNVVTIISNILNKNQISSVLPLKFIYIPGTTKQPGAAMPYAKTKIYCKQLDKEFESQVDAAQYMLDNKLWTGIKLKTAKLRISDVVNGIFQDYKGYSFQKI